jgi:hypothetical protein
LLSNSGEKLARESIRNDNFYWQFLLDLLSSHDGHQHLALQRLCI